LRDESATSEFKELLEATILHHRDETDFRLAVLTARHQTSRGVVESYRDSNSDGILRL
jgi:hypothetical protein